MKTKLILAAAFSALAFNAFAADGFDKTHSSSFAVNTSGDVPNVVLPSI